MTAIAKRLSLRNTGHVTWSGESSPLLSPQSPYGREHAWLRMDELSAVGATVERKVAAALLVFYFTSTLLFYSGYLGWSVLDSVYFATVTFTTVGYGDLSPTEPLAKLVTCFFSFLAVGIIAAALGILMGDVIDAEACQPQSAKTEVVDCLSGCKCAAQAFGLILLPLALGSTVFTFLEGQSLLDSFYWSCTTLTTIGYGDMVPHTTAGKLFAIVFMIFGTAFVGKVLEAIVQLPLDLRRRRMEEKVRTQFGEDLQREELIALIEEAENLGIAKSSDKTSCTCAEFVVAMLVSSGKIQHADLKMALAVFQQLDQVNDFTLDVNDICRACAAS